MLSLLLLGPAEQPIKTYIYITIASHAVEVSRRGTLVNTVYWINRDRTQIPRRRGRFGVRTHSNNRDRPHLYK